MLSTTQFLILEVGSFCNLGKIHPKCPNAIRTPSGPNTLTDEIILQCIDDAYTKFNFTGLVGWHYYNEPMVEYKRIFSLMEKYPNGRYILWTNGTLQPDDPRINLFEQVYCTEYTKINRDYYKGCKSVSVFPPKFDDRLKDTKSLPENMNRCVRPNIELTIDNWGEAHLCCQDWRGEVKIGNLWEDGFEAIVTKKYEIMERMKNRDLPERCKKCKAKVYNLPKFDIETYRRTLNI